LIADIQAPDIETRIAILQKKAESEGLPIAHDVAIFLASKFDANIRELEGSLTRLGAFASLAQKPITVEFAREVLKSLLKEPNSQVSIEMVQDVISKQFSIRLTDLKSAKRTKSVAFARQVAMYLSRKLTGASLPAIGEKFGKDHSTVVHAIHVVQKRRDHDPGFQTTIDSLERMIADRSKL
jgi:chromosomal replication initiator protein